MVEVIERVWRIALGSLPSGIRIELAYQQVCRILVHRVKDTGPSRKGYWSIGEEILVHRVKDTGPSRRFSGHKSSFCRINAISVANVYVLVVLFLMYVVGKK